MLTPGALTSTDASRSWRRTRGGRCCRSLRRRARSGRRTTPDTSVRHRCPCRRCPAAATKSESRSVRKLDRFQEALREVASRPRVVEHIGTVRSRVEDRADCICGRPGSVAAEELQPHQADVPVHADDADTVVSDRADRAGDMRPVPLVVCRVVVAVDEVPAAPVVDVAVSVVVDAVRATTRAVLSGVDPRVRGEIGMRLVDAGVDHGDHDAGITGRDRPGCVDVGIRVGCAGPAVDELAGVAQPPKAVVQRIVRDGGRLEHVVRLRVPDERVSTELGEHRVPTAR